MYCFSEAHDEHDLWSQQFDQPFVDETVPHNSIRGESIGSVEDSDNFEHEVDGGTFHTPVNTSSGSSSHHFLCGNITER